MCCLLLHRLRLRDGVTLAVLATQRSVRQSTDRSKSLVHSCALAAAHRPLALSFFVARRASTKLALPPHPCVKRLGIARHQCANQ